MKKSIGLTLLFMVVIGTIYRVIPGRPAGFAPQLSLALLGGFLFNQNKKWAFALPLLSMIVSDGLYQVLYSLGLPVVPGFYGFGQIVNYILIALMSVFGLYLRRLNIRNILIGSLCSPSIYFLLSNFFVWISRGGYVRPLTPAGLVACYSDGLPFYFGSLAATIFFMFLFYVAISWVLSKGGKREGLASFQKIL